MSARGGDIVDLLPPVPVSGLAGVTFLTADPPSMRQFYGQGAGFAEVPAQLRGHLRRGGVRVVGPEPQYREVWLAGRFLHLLQSGPRTGQKFIAPA